MEQAAPNHGVVDKKQKVYFSCRCYSLKVRNPSPHWVPQLGVPVPGREVPITSGWEKTVEIVAEYGCKLLESQALLLKSLCLDLRAGLLTCSELQHWVSSLKNARDIQRGIGLSGFRARAGRTAFSHNETLAGTTFPWLSPSHTQPADAGWEPV